ncbi:hypothetical protein [Shewanella avicenniae]|nr:hypothetical protein [Shewanella avicenniae]
MTASKGKYSAGYMPEANANPSKELADINPVLYSLKISQLQ